MVGLRAVIGLMGQYLLRNVYVTIGVAIVALLMGSVKHLAPAGQKVCGRAGRDTSRLTA